MKKLLQLISFSKGPKINDFLGNYIKMLFFWNPLVTVLFMFGFNGFDEFGRRFLTSYSIAFACGTFCMGGAFLIEFLYRQVCRKQKRIPVPHGPLWGILVSYIFLVPGLYVGFKLASLISMQMGHPSSTPDFRDYSSGIIFGVLVSALFLVFEVLRESKAAKQAAELKFRQLENENLKAQISALSAQMNPHLLFNALNTIASTIVTDPKSAEDMVVQLSELYRGILKSAKGDVHSLENELFLCKSYLEIEKKRFGSRVQYKIEMDDQIDPLKIKLPVLLLQPLVENSVKHGLSPLKHGGTIRLDIKMNHSHLVISVIDNGVGPGNVTVSSGTGTGLSNCEARIRLKYGAASQFSFSRNPDNETSVVLQIPRSELQYD